MDDYREYVEAVAKAEDGKEIIRNKTTAHAGILLAALLRKAKREVLIVSGQLDGRAYDTDEVIAATDQFLASSPEARLKIVVEQPLALANCRFLAHLRDVGAMDRHLAHHAQISSRR